MKGYRSAGQFIIFALIFGLFLALVHPFILPVILGLLISLIFRPIYSWLLKQFSGRKHLAATSSTLIVILCIFLPIVFIGIYVVKDVTNLVKEVAPVANGATGQTQQIMDIPAVANLYQAINTIHAVPREEFAEWIRKATAELTISGKNFLRGMATSVPKKLIAIIFFFVAFYFGLNDGPRLVQFLQANSPFPARETHQLFLITYKICNAVVLGAVLAGMVQGTIVGLAYWILGIPQPLLFGVITAIFGLIPLVGCAPTSIGGTIYLLAAGKPLRALFMLIAFLLAGISDNIVKPWVLKGKTELHPLLGLLSVLGGIRLFGFPGLFLGPVTTALTIVLLQLLHHRVQSAKAENIT